jgi:hypothetical protein
MDKEVKGLSPDMVEPPADQPQPKPGSAGGRALVERRGLAHMREMGGNGGRRTVELYGSEHMRTMGKLGFQAYADRYCGGKRSQAIRQLLGDVYDATRYPTDWRYSKPDDWEV